MKFKIIFNKIYDILDILYFIQISAFIMMIRFFLSQWLLIAPKINNIKKHLQNNNFGKADW